MAKIKGSNGNDHLSGTNKADTIFGRGGNDTIVAKKGDDEIEGGSGNDWIDGGSGNDEIEGGKGDDTIFGGSGNDEIEGGDGNDWIDGGSGNDRIYGGSGNDWIFGGSGKDKIYGDTGNDKLFGGEGDDYVDGGTGNDKIFGGSGNDRLFGGKGDDKIFGGTGNDRLEGEKGNDFLDGGAGNDVVLAGRDNDTASYNMAENLGPGFADIGTHDVYDGGRGFDTLKLTLTHGESQLASVQQDITNYRAFLTDHANPRSDCGPTFHFASFDLDARGFEALAIQLVNTTPTANDDAGATNEDTPLVVLAAGVLANDTDPDHLDQLTVVGFDAISASGALVVVGADGGYSYDPNGMFEYLALGQIAFDSFGYTVADLAGANDGARVTITVIGVNDPVTVTGGKTAGDLIEDESNPTLSETGTLNFADVDLIDTHFAMVTPDAGNPVGGGLSAMGTDNGDGTGTVDWTYTVANANTQYLAEGETATEKFTVKVFDTHGSFDTELVTLTLTGVNDVPVITSGAQSGSATELADLTPGENATLHTAAGAVTFTDVDTLDTHSATFAPQGGGVGYRGTFALDPADSPTVTGNAVGWTFEVDDSALDSLRDGELLTQKYDVTVNDGHGGTAMQTVTLTLIGTNDVATITGETSGMVVEAGGVANGTPGTPFASGDLNISDVDTGEAVFQASSSVAGTYGDFTFNAATGAWTYTLNNLDADTEALADSAPAQDSLTVLSFDGTTNATIVIGITGANDAPVITSNGGGDSANVFVAENTTAVTDVNADDPDTALLTHTVLPTAGTDFAAFNINSSSGALTFASAPDFEAPTDVGGTPGDNIYLVDVQVSDGLGGTDTQSIAVTVTGSHVSAGDDFVLTNVAQGDPITIPGFALLANDTDAEGHPLGVATVANAAANDVVSLVGDDVLYTDNVPYDGSSGFFDYKASDGSLESPFAHVTVETQVGAVIGTPKNEILIASDADDFLFGGAGDDFLFGAAGGDFLFGEVDDDMLFGGNSADTLFGDVGNDSLFGDAGSDNLFAGLGNDTLDGGAGDDSLFGEDGNDTLVGGLDNDYLEGGAGSDVFDYNALSDAGTAGDSIIGFEKGADDLDLHDLLESLGAPHDMTVFSPAGFLRFEQPGDGNTLVQVDSDGGGDSFMTLATLSNVLLSSTDTGDFIL